MNSNHMNFQYFMGRALRAGLAFRELSNWGEVYRHILRGRALTEIRRRDGLSIIGRPGVELWELYNEIWFRRNYTRCVEIPTGAVVLDIGANVGIFSLLAASRGSMVHAFEPSAETFQYLQRNTGVMQNIRHYNLAVGAFEGNGYMDVSGLPTAYTLCRGDAPKRERVSVVTLEGALELCSLERCDFLKLDCEGAEFDIILNSPETVLRRIDRIALEFHEHLSQFRHEDLITRLSACGFVLTVYDQRGPFGMIAGERRP